jgi:hypothetical protein
MPIGTEAGLPFGYRRLKDMILQTPDPSTTVEDHASTGGMMVAIAFEYPTDT